jgi:hypothetical protein
VDQARAGGFRFDAGGLGAVGRDLHAALVALIVPAVGGAGVLGLHGDIEGVRLRHRAVAAQEILLRLESKHVALAIQAGERDGELHLSERHRLAADGGPGVVLRRHAVLEDRQLHGKVAVGEQAPAVRTLGGFGGFGLAGGVGVGVGGHIGLAATGEPQRQQQRQRAMGKLRVHGRVLQGWAASGSPVRRSISAWKTWAFTAASIRLRRMAMNSRCASTHSR